MAVLRCRMCDGELKRKNNGLFECLYCGTVQSFDGLPANFKYQETITTPSTKYEQACELMKENSIYFLQQAADMFGSLSGYQDASDKQEECLRAIRQQQDAIEQRNAKQRHEAEKIRRKSRIRVFLILTFIAAIIFLIVWIPKTIHSEQSINIEIVDVWGRSDERYHYVYMDFEIENDTGATIDYIEVTTYFSDETGKNLGTVTSSFGSSYGNTMLNLKPRQTVIKETYLSENKSSGVDDLFVMLYNDGTDDLIITYEITYVQWSDGHTYSR